MVRTAIVAACLTGLGVTVFQASPASQARPPRTRPAVIPSVYGRDLFEFYCATCHGRDGRGQGPVAAALKTAPADLTGIAARNGGTFPRARIVALVTGDASDTTAAHGSKDMPVWGPVFQALEPGETMNRVRISNIVDHIESIQRQ